MFDSTLCYRTLTKLPLYVSLRQLTWFKPILLVVILLLFFFCFRWVVRNTRLRRWFTKPIAILLLFGFTATLPLMFVLANTGLVAFLPPDPGTKTDAIVVLGRGWHFYQRIEVAAELWRAKRAPKIFISGMNDAPIFIDLLESIGIPNQVLDGENCSLTTQENAIFTSAILKPQGIRRILLITDPPHMLRSLLLFRAFGFTVIPKVSSLPPYLGYKAEAFITLREYAGLISYGLRGLFLNQRSPEASNPALVKLIEEAEKYGQQQSFQ